MGRRLFVTILILVISLILTLPGKAQQKPFTQEQVASIVRAGLGDDSGSKLVEQRGIDFAPSEDLIQILKAAGASEAFLKALRAAKPPEPSSAKRPINQVQVFALLKGGTHDTLTHAPVGDDVGRKLVVSGADLRGCVRDFSCPKGLNVPLEFKNQKSKSVCLG